MRDEDLIEPGPAPDTEALPALDSVTLARSVGYPWEQIDNHIAESSAKAAEFGYSQPEIDKHLGYADPGPFLDRSVQAWRGYVAADPGFASGLSAPDPEINLFTPSMQEDYTKALLGGEVKGPRDFAQGYASAALQASHQDGDLIEPRAAAGAAAAAELENALPDPRDLTDAALSLSGNDPSLVPTIRRRLMEHWQDTGEQPVEAAIQADKDAALLAKLSANDLTVTEGDERKGGGVFNELLRGQIEQLTGKPNDEAIGQLMLDHPELSREEAQYIASNAQAENEPLYDRLDRLAHVLIGGILGAPEGITRFAEKALESVGKVNVIDPLAAPGEHVTQELAKDAFLPAKPAAMEVPKLAEGAAEGAEAAKPLIVADASPSEKIQRLVQLHEENSTPTTTESGFFFQRLVQNAAEEGHPIDPATVELAKGYDTASFINYHFRNILADESGAKSNPLVNLFRTNAERNEREGFVDARDYAQNAIIRFRSMGEQEQAWAANQLESYYRPINAHMREFEDWLRLGPARPPDDTNAIMNMYNYMEGRSLGAAMNHDSGLTPVADQIRLVNQRQENILRAEFPDMTGFYEDYVRHYWENPTDADRVYAGTGKQGSAASLREREIPTISAGLDRGLMPKITNPIELTLYDVTAKQNYIAGRRILQSGRDGGYVKYNTGGPPEPGWVELRGMSSKIPAGDSGLLQTAYAHPGFAKIYNDWLGIGFHSRPFTASLYDRFLYSANMLTAFKLALPLYHAGTMSLEGMISHVSLGLGELGRGNVASGLGSLAKAPLAPAELAIRGRRLQQDYLNLAGDEALNRLAEGGLRMQGRQAIYRMGETPDIFRSISRGTLGQELTQDVQHIFGSADEVPAKRIAMVGPRMAGFVGRETGRIFNTMTAPMFDHVIPWMKIAAGHQEMQSWLSANTTASEAVKFAKSRQIADAIDNRLGELNQDNIFWPKAVKQALNAVTVSLGWEYGSFRYFSNSLGWNVDKMSREWNPVATRALVGTAITYAMVNSLLQYAHSGQMPWNTGTPFHDMLNWRTGAMTPEGVPERGQTWGYIKDALQYAKVAAQSTSPWSLAQNIVTFGTQKYNPLVSTLMGWLVTGQDGIGHRIAYMPGEGFKVPGLGWEIPKEWMNYLRFAGKQFKPIALETAEQMPKGSGIPMWERWTGLRNAPTLFENPDKFWAGQQGMAAKYTREELQRATRENNRLENPQEIPGGGAVGGGSSAGSTGPRTPREFNNRVSDINRQAYEDTFNADRQQRQQARQQARQQRGTARAVASALRQQAVRQAPARQGRPTGRAGRYRRF